MIYAFTLILLNGVSSGILNSARAELYSNADSGVRKKFKAASGYENIFSLDMFCGIDRIDK